MGRHGHTPGRVTRSAFTEDYGGQTRVTAAPADRGEDLYVAK